MNPLEHAPGGPTRWLSVIFAALAAIPLAAQQGDVDFDETGVVEVDFTEMSLEDLLEVEVEVTGRSDETWFSSASSIFVLTSEQIRSSTKESVPELLRLVPGLIVAQIEPGAYEFSSRTGQLQFAGMLVLIDGQRLYPTLLDSEYWQALDIPIETIERIEVIRGPGGAVWGDSAGQGVINIVTKHSKDMQGVFASAAVGNEMRWSGLVGYGGKVGEDISYYLYGRGVQWDGSNPSLSGSYWRNGRLGLRVDGQSDEALTWNVDGQMLYSKAIAATDSPPAGDVNRVPGGHLKAKALLRHDGGSESGLRVGVSGYDQDIDFFDGFVDERLRFREEFFNIVAQHRFSLGDAHRITLGQGFRHQTVQREFREDPDFNTEDNEARSDTFVSWEWQICDHWRASVGANLSYEDGTFTTGFRFQPDLRVAYTPSNTQTWWASANRTRELASRFSNGTDPVDIERQPEIYAFEAGYRQRVGETLVVQVDLFHYEIEEQISGFTFDPMMNTFINFFDARSDVTGGEVAATWRPTDSVQIGGYWSLSVADSDGDPLRFDPELNVPRNRAALTLSTQPYDGFSIDSELLYTEGKSGVAPTNVRFDLGLTWRPNNRTRVRLIGQNLFDPHHPETQFGGEKERSVFLYASHRF